MEKPSKETWVNWVQHPATQYFLHAINSKREMLKEGIAENQTGVLVKEYIGQCMGIRDCLEYALKDYEFAGKGEENLEENKNES